ncbi:MAG: ribonuclease H-like domain-containing protein [Halanaerobiales bacterium]|nr:ribonuclease H-like domain-containing protein [Halanaerobiales bacterium]
MKNYDKKVDRKKRVHEKENIEYIDTDKFNSKDISNQYGRYIVSINHYNYNFKHGLYQIDQLFKGLNKSVLESILNKTSNTDFVPNLKEKMLFVDTETTGLMGGTGTCAFLIGLAFFENDTFTVKQYLMRDYDEEPAMLSDIKKIFDEKEIVISFNGKSFDLPLIKTRLILNKFEQISYSLHLDLLHSARRIWSYLDSCSLSSLEENILNFQRTKDIPGYYIPNIYFEFLKSKKLELLAPIFEHNIYDILSLVTLLTHLKEVYQESVVNLCADELYRIGKIKEKNKEYKSSIKYYKKACLKYKDNGLKYKVLKSLSWQYKRINSYNKAVEIWNEMINDFDYDQFPYIELAKYFEHKEKNYKKALSYTLSAKNLLYEKSIMIERYSKKLKNINHRIKRLKDKNDI